jgi:hypothetical protein
LRIENFSFHSRTGTILGLLDFDTVGAYELEEEFCDALRSWCAVRFDHARKDMLSIESFEAALDGYLAEAGKSIHGEIHRLVVGLERIYLELAARFCLASAGLPPFKILVKNPADRLRRCIARAASACMC